MTNDLREVFNNMVYGCSEPLDTLFISIKVLKCIVNNNLLLTLINVLNSYGYRYLCVNDFKSSCYKLLTVDKELPKKIRKITK